MFLRNDIILLHLCQDVDETEQDYSHLQNLNHKGGSTNCGTPAPHHIQQFGHILQKKGFFTAGKADEKVCNRVLHLKQLLSQLGTNTWCMPEKEKKQKKKLTECTRSHCHRSTTNNAEVKAKPDVL